jgi:alkylhydroperoxidase/carboxymuconolactone decarboxylase family protein YurZ
MGSEKIPEAWVNLPTLDEMAAAGQFPDHHPYNLGYVPAMGRLISAHPRLAPYFGALFGQIMFAPGALSRAEREMVAAVAAAAQDCHY